MRSHGPLNDYEDGPTVISSDDDDVQSVEPCAVDAVVGDRGAERLVAAAPTGGGSRRRLKFSKPSERTPAEHDAICARMRAKKGERRAARAQAASGQLAAEVLETVRHKLSGKRMRFARAKLQASLDRARAGVSGRARGCSLM